MKMTMMKTMIFKPNYRNAEIAAHKMLEINHVQELPVRVKKLSKKFSNLRIKTYSWFADKHDMTISEVCDFANSDEGCCYFQKSTGKYLILYNDQVANKGRIRWTIAHELGHFMLGHNEISNRTVLGRNALTKSEYDVFEKEANCFARELLAPPTIITQLGKITASEIQDICDMSIEAASNVITFLKNGQRMGYGYTLNTHLRNLFSKYIFKMKNKHYCNNCQCYFISESPFFCPICNSTEFYKTFYRGMTRMKYSGYEVDDMGKAIECPICGNEELHYEGEHCKICGTMVRNKCGNISVWNGEVEWECGTLLDGNARFCQNCGHESTFFQQGLLDSWENERREKEAKKNNKEDVKNEKVLIPFGR